MEAPAHLQPKVVIGPPSRKRACPEPDDLVAFAAESSDSSQLVPGVQGRLAWLPKEWLSVYTNCQ